MKLPNNLPRTVAELCESPEVQAHLCSFPEVQRIVMQTFAAAYSLCLLDNKDQDDVDGDQIWQTFYKALNTGYLRLDDEIFVRSNYTPFGNSEIVSQS
jgi:hypothetical protein